MEEEGFQAVIHARKLWGWVFALSLLGGVGMLMMRSGPRARVLAFISSEATQEATEGGVQDIKRGDKQREREDEEGAAGRPGEAPSTRVSRSAGGQVVVVLDLKVQQRIALRVEALAAATHQPQALAYGLLEEDPGESFTLRAPLSGTLRAAPEHPWPKLGETLEDNTAIGMLEPRWTPAEHLDMASRLAAAQAEVSSAAAALEAARTSYESKKELRDRDKVVSDRAVEEAAARVKTEEARLRAATDTVLLLESCLETHAAPGRLGALTLPHGGEVVEVTAQPGEAVESGQVLLRVVRFDRLLARVEVPAGERLDQPVSSARLVVVGHEDWGIRGEPIGLAPSVGLQTQGAAYLFRVAVNSLPVRPGTAVVAYLSMPGDPLAGVVLPRSAMVRYAGGAWVYVQVGEDRFERREAALRSPTETGWFVTAGVTAGERVVVTAAQVLLSEELKAQIEREQEAEE